MKNNKFLLKNILLVGVLSSVMISSGVFALTPKEEKGVKTLKAPSLVYESPEWFTPFTLDQAPQDISYWKSILPYSEDKAEEMYVVIPTLGLITPVVFVPEGTDDFTKMAAGGVIDINKYLVEGVMHYPTSGKPGQVANPVIFGHSNFYLQGEGKYKTIFADIMNLDVGPYDEIRVYTRESEGTGDIIGSGTSNGTGNEAKMGNYKMQRFAIEQSYETTPTDVEILLPQGGKELTVFACTNGLAGRWILRARLIEADEVLIPFPMRRKTFELMQQLKDKSPERKEEITLIVLEKINEILSNIPSNTQDYKLKFKKYILQYLERELAEVY